MTKRYLILMAYALSAIFLVGSWVYIGHEVVQQHGIFAAIDDICNGSEEEILEGEQFLRAQGREALLYVLQELLRKPSESPVNPLPEETLPERFAASRVRVAALSRRIVEDIVEERAAFLPGKVYVASKEDASKLLAEDITIIEMWKGRSDAILITQMITLLSFVGDPGDPENAAANELVEAVIAIGDPAVTSLAQQLGKGKVDPVMVQPTKEDKSKLDRERVLNEYNRQARIRCAKALGRIATERAVVALRTYKNDDDRIVAEIVREALRTAIQQNPAAESLLQEAPE